MKRPIWVEAIANIFRWLAVPYVWWRQIDLGRCGTIFLLSDSAAIFYLIYVGVSLLFMVPIGDMLIWLGGKILPDRITHWIAGHFMLSGAALLCLLPFVLLKAVWIRPGRVDCYCLAFGLPYWRHRLPQKPNIVLYEAWGDPAPSGVVLGTDAVGEDGTHLGTATSAEGLFRALVRTLQPYGWQQISFDCYRYVGTKRE